MTSAPWKTLFATLEDRKPHEQMGFHPGWPIATEQLASLVE